MDAWNTELFLALNAGAAPGDITVLAAKIAASWFTTPAVGILAALWIWGAPAKRGAVVTATVALLIGLTINFTISLAWYHPRPFEVGVGRTLVKHALETSFPSDHATFLWSLAFGLIVARSRWGWGLFIGGLGLATAWARVYLGVHFPFDMVGSFVVAVLGAACAAAARRQLMQYLLPVAEGFYETVLRVLHFPAPLFPRRPI